MLIILGDDIYESSYENLTKKLNFKKANLIELHYYLPFFRQFLSQGQVSNPRSLGCEFSVPRHCAVSHQRIKTFYVRNLR